MLVVVEGDNIRRASIEVVLEMHRGESSHGKQTGGERGGDGERETERESESDDIYQ